MIICMMTTASHIHRAMVMAESAKKHHPHAKLIVCLVENNVHPEIRAFRHFDEIILAGELDIPNFNRFIFARSIREASYALKGHFLKYLFKTYPGEKQLIYLDTDVEIVGPFQEVEQALEEHPIVLTPHEVSGTRAKYLFHGIFNIGFLALKRSVVTARFLDWWIGKTDRYCFDEHLSQGIFYEQGWLNSAPAYFDVFILHHPGYNVAFWNLSERGKSISLDKNGQYTVDGMPMRFFHFSHAENRLIRVMKRHVPSGNSAIYKLHRQYIDKLRKTDQAKWSKLPWSYDFHPDGKKITPDERKQYKSADSEAAEANHRPLRIVQVLSNAPRAWPLPPVNQGGAEKIVNDLTEALVRQGHEVILYAARGSRSSAKLIEYPANVKESGIAKFVADSLPPGTDLIHDHTFSSAVARGKLPVPTVCTHHMPRNNGVVNSIYVSRRALAVIGENNGYCVRNGISLDEYEFSEEKRDYLLFIGRILRGKGILHALDVAEKTDHRLIIAGPVKDRALFEKHIKPRMLKNPNIEYVGPVGGERKQELLKHAKCVLFPSIWEEPFGLVMIEAMACGTPVVALENGAVPEVMAGFPNLVCSSVDDMIRKVLHEPFPAAQLLRNYVSEHFTTEKMAAGYMDIYRHTIRKANRIRPVPKTGGTIKRITAKRNRTNGRTNSRTKKKGA